MNISHKSCHEQNSEYWIDYITQFRCNTHSLEVHTIPEHLSPSPVLSGVRVARSVVLCTCFVERCLSFCTFSFYSVVLSVLLWYADCDYPFDIFRLFFQKQQQFEDTKLVIWSRNSTRGKSYHGQKTKQRMVDTLLHKKLKIDQRESH